MPFKSKCRVVENIDRGFLPKITLVIFLSNDGVNLWQSEHFKLLCTVQDDGVTAILVFAPICPAPVFDDGCTDIVFDCKVPANVPGSSSAKWC